MRKLVLVGAWKRTEAAEGSGKVREGERLEKKGSSLVVTISGHF